MAKYSNFELPENFGRDWHYCRPITVMRAKQLPAGASVKVGGKTVDAEPGDYVVLLADGSLNVLSEEDFNASYTIVPPAKIDTHFNQTTST